MTINEFSCTVKKFVNKTTIVCPDGSSSDIIDGTNGQEGMRGAMGPTGAQGDTGMQGVTGEVGKPIKFCPEQTGGSFPEYGFCIQNELYAVYFDKQNAWLAKVVPGKYISTSTNNQCIFTVEDNCVIINQ